MKIYKSNPYFRFIFFGCFSLYIILFFNYNLRHTGYAFIGWIISLFGILSFYWERKILKVILDKERGKISFIYGSNFSRKKEIFEFRIDEVSCFVNKAPGGRGKMTLFEIIVNDQKFDTFHINADGWDVDDLRDLIKEINKLK